MTEIICSEQEECCTMNSCAPHIGDNGNWFFGCIDTGVKARGEDGATPYIGKNGNWHFGTSDTGISSKGEPGTNGKDAFEFAIANGFSGSVSEWLLSLKGKDGEPGTFDMESPINYIVPAVDSDMESGNTISVLFGKIQKRINETKDKVNSLNDSLLEKVYPVGCIYLSANAVNPAALFGGSWEPIKDRFLLGAGPLSSGGSTGGTKAETLQTNQIPAHLHDFGRQDTNWFASTIGASGSSAAPKAVYFDIPNITTNFTGGNQPHNNMPPYLTVYMWKRNA